MNDSRLRQFQAAGPPADLLISSVYVLDPRSGIDGARDVLIRGGMVAEVAPADSLEAPAGSERVDGRGRHLFPGFVDPHVHLRSPGQEYKEDVRTGTTAAAAGGFVSIIAMPNTAPPIDSVPILEAVIATARAEARIPTGFLAAITVGLGGRELTEMAALRDAGALGFTDDGKPVTSAGLLRRALQYQRLVGGALALHEEDPELSGAGVMHEGAVSARLGLAGIPSVSESTFIARDAALARYEEAAVHFQHVSAAESVEALGDARIRADTSGVRISAEATPHHLTLTDEALTGLDTRLKMNPPLRTEADRQAIVDGLRSGLLTCIATDHAPHARHEKEQPLEQAPMGTTGLETAFAAVFSELVRPGVLSLALVVERLSAGGEPFGLAPPTIQPGVPANLVLINLEGRWVVGAHGYRSRSANCCFDGRRLWGVVDLTIAAGQVAFRATADGGHPHRQEDR
ncbi:dihydroorotase [Conexibacter sp. DBS9H8]|uniref:dihydroorotase n=1 Tax=Conexibacter sp. DBS9H8 TaxID=2937801 RepID=UPI00200F0EC3|nr:dihydroorotase [Conexibacter sp. DBS9H8]